MTQLYQGNLARHVRLARQSNGNGSDNAGGLDAVPPPSSPTTTGSSNGNRGDNDGGSGSVSPTSGPTTTDALTSPTSASATSPSVSPTPTSSAPSITPSSVQSTRSSSSVVQSSTTLSSSPTSTLTPTSALPTDSTLSSSSTFSSAQFDSAVLQQTPTTTTFSNPLANPDEITPTPSYGTQTNVFSPVTTVSASALPETSSNVSAGNIVGAVVGTLIGLALLVVFVAFVFRRYRRSRRRAMRDSDFGTFRRSMFVTPRSSATPTRGSMSETSHNITPSLKEPYVPYSARTAKQPSQTPEAATSAATPASGGGGVALQERPKYVYGQGVTTTSEKQEQQDQDEQQQQQQHDDAVSDAHGGAYSSEPQVQSAYNPEAYGHYAKYEDIGDGVVGGVPAGTTVYQDAERAYQGQQGYNQGHYDPANHASYDRSQYHGYGQHQQQAYGYSSQYPRAQVPESKGPAGTYVAF